MTCEEGPLVSILTPVYNGGRYIAECIESVLAQTYKKWEYIIVNNCSTDDTLQIVEKYVRQDSRLTVVNNHRFLDVIANHNAAFRCIAQESKYSKVVAADDYLLPECIEKLMALAESDPEIALVGSYAITSTGIQGIPLPPSRRVFEGREVSRLYFLGLADPFAAPSAVLYRSAIVRSHDPFYPGSLPNADFAACLRCLATGKFGFVHQVLSYQRIHGGAISHSIADLNGFLLDRLQFLEQFGPMHLTSQELEDRRKVLLGEVYRALALGAIHCRGRQFWQYQRQRLEAMGRPMCRLRIAGAVFAKLVDLALNPKLTGEKLLRHAAALACPADKSRRSIRLA
jgi:glycosyltransferase involved in cell wall biosynthesis